MNTRMYWLKTMLKIADPVVQAAAEGRLKQDMPVECKTQREVRERFTHLEAVGRTICGMGPWLACKGLSGEEEKQRIFYSELVRRVIDRTTDPKSPDFLNYCEGRQPLVDVAFYAHGLLRGREELLDKLEPRVKENLIHCLESSRKIKPGYNNFILFSAMVEAALCYLGRWWDPMRVEYALKTYETWYAGDGVYGDGPEYCWNYYNSYVIQPMFMDLCHFFRDKDPDWKDMYGLAAERARRYAAIQERLIGTDGSFPPVGRSLAYRFGAFQHLAQMSLEHNLPDGMDPAQVRCGLTAMIRKVVEAPGTFDENGWLHIGFCGWQPDVGEIYISTGSLYLCMAVFLPLGLNTEDCFWSNPDKEWTAKRMWRGGSCEIDEALHYLKHQTIYDHDEYLAKGGKH